MDQFVNHHLTVTAALFRTVQIGGGKVRFIQQAGAAGSISAPGNAALDQLQRFAAAEGQRSIVCGAILHHIPHRIGRVGLSHNVLMLAAIVKLDGHAPGLNILPDVISGIEDAAGADIFPAPGFGAILMLCNDLCPAGAKRDRCHGIWKCNFHLCGIVVLIGQYIQQPRGERRVFQL